MRIGMQDEVDPHPPATRQLRERSRYGLQTFAPALAAMASDQHARDAAVVQRARRELGYAPIVSFEEGLAELRALRERALSA